MINERKYQVCVDDIVSHCRGKGFYVIETGTDRANTFGGNI